MDPEEETPTPKIINCTINANSSENGGAIYNNGPNTKVVNCTIYENTQKLIAGTPLPLEKTGGVYNYVSSDGILVLNTIVWSNEGVEQIMNLPAAFTAVRYSNIQGGIYPGTGNISEAPVFRDAAAGDFHLRYDWFGTSTSPGVDAGSPNTDPDFDLLPSYDFEGDYRIINGPAPGPALTDIGVDEVRSLFGDIVVDGRSVLAGVPGTRISSTYYVSLNLNDLLPGITEWKNLFTSKNAEIENISFFETDAEMLIKKGLADGKAYITKEGAVAAIKMTQNPLHLNPQNKFITAAITLSVKIPKIKSTALLSMTAEGASYIEFENQRSLPFASVNKKIKLIPIKQIKK